MSVGGLECVGKMAKVSRALWQIGHTWAYFTAPKLRLEPGSVVTFARQADEDMNTCNISNTI